MHLLNQRPPGDRSMGNAAPASTFFSATTSSFTVLSVTLAGILATSILLLAYYLFLTRSSFSSWRLDGVLITPHPHPPAPAPARGLDHAAIRRIPTFRYRKHPQEEAPAAAECAVCLSEFRDGERLRLLPPCLHAFHIDCIDAWLHATANCPLCRTTLFPPQIHIDILQPHHPNTALVSPSPSPGEMNMTVTDHQCLDPRRDGLQVQQRMRRSFSMDSSNDKHLYLALHKALQRQQHSAAILGDSVDGKFAGESSGRTGRLRRSFFSFSHGRSSTSAAIFPV